MNEIQVLMAFQDPNKSAEIQRSLQQLKRLKFFESRDGIDVQFKLANSIPQILLIEDHLPRRSGISVCEWVLQQRKLQELAMILVSDEGYHAGFADFAASGRIQYIRSELDASELKLAFIRAFNFVSGTHGQDFKVRLVPSGEVLIREGEKASAVYLVQSGKLSASQKRGEDQTLLGEIGPGEFVGEMAYINQDMRSATVIAESDSELVEIPISHIDQILFQKPSWAKALMRTLSKRLKISNLKVD